MNRLLRPIEKITFSSKLLFKAFLSVSFFLFHSLVCAEGTKQVSPTSSQISDFILVNPNIFQLGHQTELRPQGSKSSVLSVVSFSTSRFSEDNHSQIESFLAKSPFQFFRFWHL